MAAPGSEKSSKKKTEKKLAAREEAKLLAGFMGVMNSMRKQVRAGGAQRSEPGGGWGGGLRTWRRHVPPFGALLPVRALDKPSEGLGPAFRNQRAAPRWFCFGPPFVPI